jgi:hypothetical protein
MDLRRVLLFTGLLALVMALVSLSLTGLGTKLAAGPGGLPGWYAGVQAGLSIVVVLLVFFLLGRTQHENLFMHAFTVAVFGWLASYVPNVLLLHQPTAAWLTGVAHLVLVGLVGSLLGRASRGESAAT